MKAKLFFLMMFTRFIFVTNHAVAATSANNSSVDDPIRLMTGMVPDEKFGEGLTIK